MSSSFEDDFVFFTCLALHSFQTGRDGYQPRSHLSFLLKGRRAFIWIAIPKILSIPDGLEAGYARARGCGDKARKYALEYDAVSVWRK